QRHDGHWDKSIPARLTSAEAISWWQSLPPSRQGTLFPEWTSTAWSLMLLRAFGLDPDCAQAREAIRRVHDQVAWEHDGEPFFAGEVEPCINGKVVALGAYFGQDVHGIVDRLLGEQMSDGGWNCERESGSTRGSFHSTIDVLAGPSRIAILAGCISKWTRAMADRAGGTRSARCACSGGTTKHLYRPPDEGG